ncbi:MAG: hypothetical protein J0H74_36710 [Chitinophagaceae bacterium]|nr:hypothetical protein [Chitinophagaceae bacterium]
MKPPQNGAPQRHPVHPPGGNFMDGVISRRPGVAVRFALPTIILVLILVLGGAWGLHYPQTISTLSTIAYPTRAGMPAYADVSIPQKYFGVLRDVRSVRFYFTSGYYAGKGEFTGDLKFMLDGGPGDALNARITFRGRPVGSAPADESDQNESAGIVIVVKDMRLIERVLYKPAH